MELAIKHNHEQLIDVDTAVEKVLSNVDKLGLETKSILEALSHVAFENVIAEIDIPQVNNSSMDGYAVKSRDVKKASADKPVDLAVIGMISAGQIPDVEVVENSSVKIMTGASIPQGADAVIPFEDIVVTKNKGVRVFLQKALYVGLNRSMCPI